MPPNTLEERIEILEQTIAPVLDLLVITDRQIGVLTYMVTLLGQELGLASQEEVNDMLADLPQDVQEMITGERGA